MLLDIQYTVTLRINPNASIHSHTGYTVYATLIVYCVVTLSLFQEKFLNHLEQAGISFYAIWSPQTMWTTINYLGLWPPVIKFVSSLAHIISKYHRELIGSFLDTSHD